MRHRNHSVASSDSDCLGQRLGYRIHAIEQGSEQADNGSDKNDHYLDDPPLPSVYATDHQTSNRGKKQREYPQTGRVIPEGCNDFNKPTENTRKQTNKNNTSNNTTAHNQTMKNNNIQNILRKIKTKNKTKK